MQTRKHTIILYSSKKKKTRYYLAPRVCEKWKDIVTLLLVLNYLSEDECVSEWL